MIHANRKECRLKFHELAEAKLTVENSLAGEVHPNPVQGFESTPAVVISSYNSGRQARLTFDGSLNAYGLVIEVFIPYPTETEAGYDRAAIENGLDDIDAALAELIKDNQKVAGYWEAIDFVGETETSRQELDGTQYRIEQTIIRLT